MGSDGRASGVSHGFMLAVRRESFGRDFWLRVATVGCGRRFDRG